MSTLDTAVGSLRQLPQALVRRWGRQKFYSLEQVTQSAQEIGSHPESIPYAHAAFCSRSDFDAHYPSPPAGGGYEELRAVVKGRAARDHGLELAALLMMMG